MHSLARRLRLRLSEGKELLAREDNKILWEVLMFKYQDGSAVLIGDNVLFDEGQTSGVVDLVVNTEEEVKAFKVAEVGVLLKSTPSGLVYLTRKWLKEDPLRFVSRAKRSALLKQDG
jgi:hypothetical protein